jgi:hypothetical protein
MILLVMIEKEKYNFLREKHTPMLNNDRWAG